MKKTPVLCIAILTLLLSTACALSIGLPQVVRGSGKVASETRSLSGFEAIELTGSADVIVSLGETESVSVEAEDNLLPLVETQVRGGRLVIGTKSNTTLAPTQPVRVTVTLKALRSASLTGSGNITIGGLSGGSLRLDLSGSGNISAAGTVEALSATLGGSGNILCDDLQASSASVEINGSGNVTVYASQRLEATISGSGAVTYRGNPAQVEQSVSGSGSIQPAP
jgi:hypothetical protein